MEPDLNPNADPSANPALPQPPADSNQPPVVAPQDVRTHPSRSMPDMKWEHKKKKK